MTSSGKQYIMVNSRNIGIIQKHGQKWLYQKGYTQGTTFHQKTVELFLE